MTKVKAKKEIILETKPVPPRKEKAPPKEKEPYKRRLKKFDVDAELENKKFAKTTKDGVAIVALKPNELASEQYVINPVVKYHHSFLVNHLESIGVDVQRQALAIVLLAKLYAKEQICEEYLEKEGHIFYESGVRGSRMCREHPASRTLEGVRDRIATMLKSMGLTQDNRRNPTVGAQNNGNAFEFLSDL